MNEAQLYEAIIRLYPVCANVIGFHDLAEHNAKNELKRVEYNAQAYANGYELARLVYGLIKQLDPD